MIAQRKPEIACTSYIMIAAKGLRIELTNKGLHILLKSLTLNLKFRNLYSYIVSNGQKLAVPMLRDAALIDHPDHD